MSLNIILDQDIEHFWHFRVSLLPFRSYSTLRSLNTDFCHLHISFACLKHSYKWNNTTGSFAYEFYSVFDTHQYVSWTKCIILLYCYVVIHHVNTSQCLYYCWWTNGSFVVFLDVLSKNCCKHFYIDLLFQLHGTNSCWHIIYSEYWVIEH